MKTIFLRLTELEEKTLKQMIRKQFDQCGWYEEDDIIEIARKLGFEELVTELTLDKTA